MINPQPVLVSWVGGNDIKAAVENGAGPILSTLRTASFSGVELLFNYPESDVKPYLDWLRKQVDVTVNAYKVDLHSPIHFGEIHKAAENHLARLHSEFQNIAILLNPGTPAMQAVWILLGKTRFPAIFYQSTIEQGVQTVEIPFEIAAEYLPPLSHLSSEQINHLAANEAPVDAAFDDIITRNPGMLRLKSKAQILAQRDVPVLIQGKTGTGKELFARAIHNASPRHNKPLVVLNCGAIPPDLIDSELFGHQKGAFTGAIADRSGVFEQANGGTLFLDEFGELAPAVQIRLLRILQDGTYTPVGGTSSRKTDARLIVATNRDLIQEVAAGTFREDLFFRVAVGVLHLPSLKERKGDLLLLADTLLRALGAADPALDGKKISPSAKKIILAQPWPGNVRELRATLLRAALWSQGNSLGADDIREALLEFPSQEIGIFSRDISQGVDIESLFNEVARFYLVEALNFTAGNKSQAAGLLGLKNHQTMSNWMVKHGVQWNR